MTSSHCRATPQKLYNYLGKDPSRLILHCLFQVCRTNHSRTHVTILSRQKYGKCILKRMSVPGTSLTTLSQYFVVLQMIKLNFFLGSYYMYHCRSPMLRSHYLKKNSNNPLFITKLCALRFRSTLVKSEKTFPVTLKHSSSSVFPT